jgi:hypothetical protein
MDKIFTFKEQKIHHVLVTPLDLGQRYYQIHENPRIYPSIQDLIAKAPELQSMKPVSRPATWRLSFSGIANSVASPKARTSSHSTSTFPEFDRGMVCNGLVISCYRY